MVLDLQRKITEDIQKTLKKNCQNLLVQEVFLCPLEEQLKKYWCVPAECISGLADIIVL